MNKQDTLRILRDCYAKVEALPDNGTPPPPAGCLPQYHGKGDNPSYPNDMPTMGERFDHAWYLKTYKDVAGNSCYKDKPFAHYIRHGRKEGRKPYKTDPIPHPLPKMRKFVPVGEPKRLWLGHDNAPVTVAKNGDIFTATGDGFWPIGSNHKHETFLLRLPVGKDPMKASDWEGLKGYRGKAYGIVCIGNRLYLLISDKGSGWEGMQNCRRLDVATGKKSSRTFQSLHSLGANWFVIQKGPGYKHSYHPENIVDIGCVSFAGHGHGAHHANFKTPIRLWRGDIRDLSSFREIGNADGINGPRNKWTTTMSIAYIPERKQYISGGGDWTASQIYQSVSQADNVRGPYVRKDIDDFKPPMTRSGYKDNTRWSGVFTSSYFCTRGQWYQMLSGHNPSGKPNKDDSVWCRKVKAVL